MLNGSQDWHALGEHQERRARLLFPDAKRKLEAIRAAERFALNGEAAPPKPVAVAVEIAEADENQTAAQGGAAAMWLAGFGLGAVDPLAAQRPLLGVKRTWRGLVSMSATDPKRTLRRALHGVPNPRRHLGWLSPRVVPKEFQSASGKPDCTRSTAQLSRIAGSRKEYASRHACRVIAG